MIHDAIVVGAEIAGLETLDREVISSVFDKNTDTWTLTTRDGTTCHAQVVISGNSPFVPWIPDLFGRNDFRDTYFHAAAPDPDFDPVGRRVAVIGCDATAGWFIEHVCAMAASVTVFPHHPRRLVHTNRRRRRPSARVVTSPIDSLTASGVRTRDGAHYAADAIVYGTGLAVADRDQALVGVAGVTIRQTWYDGMEPYLGIAVHGFPNYFFIAGPDTETSVRNVTLCLQLMDRSGSSRIHLRRSTQHVFNERVHLHPPRRQPAASVFDLSSSSTRYDGVYDGDATLTAGNTTRQVRARLIGHIDPIDGQYHWRGTIFDDLPTESVTVTLSIGDRSAPARISEPTPRGTYSISGVGAPPFALDAARLTVPVQ